MEILKFLEKIRTPFLDFLFSAITYLGWETIFLVVAITLIWCINKKYGFFILYCGLLGQCVSQFLKVTFQVERPWVKYPDFTPVKNAVDEATGFSFPSGHTQIATTTYGGLALLYRKKKTLSIILSVSVLLVAFSRMYLGVHYPSDVLFSLVFNSVLVIAFYLIGKRYSSQKFTDFLRLFAIIIMGGLLVFSLVQKTVNPEGAVYDETLAFASKTFGATAAFCLSWWIDDRYLNFQTKAPVTAQILKVVIGLIILLAIKEGVKFLFALIGIPSVVANFVRYFMVVFFAGTIWPYLFTKAMNK